MSLNEIIERFTLVSGFEMQEVSRYLPIILDCRLYFEEHMNAQLTEEQSRRATHACAVYAYYRISMLDCDDGLSAFKAGDVQLTVGSSAQTAQRLWEEERALIGDILTLDDDAIFRAVRV